MSKPLTMTVEQWDTLCAAVTKSRSLILLDTFKELAAVRAALAAAEAEAATLREFRGVRSIQEFTAERDKALAALADERRHVADLALALEETRCTCEAVILGGMPSRLRCVRCRTLEAHAARRAHDSECESEFDSQAHANTPCGCAARRAAEVK